MNKNKMYTKWLSCSLLALCLLLAGCSNQTSEVVPEASVSDAVQSSLLEQVEFEDDDVNDEWDKSSAVTIDFDGQQITTTAKRGVFIEQSDVTIALPGTYVLSGQLDNGSVTVNLESKGDVRLILDGVSIHHEDGAAIYVAEAGKTIITLAEGTTNMLSDGSQYTLEEDQDEPSGTLFSKDDLSINGTGKLKVEANYNDAIVSKDRLLIADGQYEIESVDDGLIGRDLIAIRQGSFMITSAGDALKATNTNEGKLGAVYIAQGSYTIEAGADGIDSAGEILIKDGDFTVKTGGGAASNTYDANSAKALKAATSITVEQGDFEMDAADDALHSNGNVTINGGTFHMLTGDDGVHADGTLTINEGNIEVLQSNEGLEGQQIVITGGVISLTTSDDGVNVAGGNDQSAFNGRGGATFQANSDALLKITGGQIVVNASGDGLDSNGNIEMSGGTVLVHGPENNGNGALDYDGTFAITGGTLIAAGSSGMAMAPSEEGSTQASILVYYPTTQAAETLIQVINAQGDAVVAFEPLKNYQSVLISTPNIVENEQYTIAYGGQSELDEELGLGVFAPSQLGSELVTFTTSSLVSYVNQDGLTTQQGGFGGFGGGGPGGGRDRGNRQGAPMTQSEDGEARS